MSRAFTKEIDDKPAEPLSDLPISEAENFVTARGAALINSKVDDLMRSVQEASPGDQELLRRDLRYWSARAASMKIIAAPTDPTSVRFGVTADVVRNGKVQPVTIVGEDEADPAAGLLAWTSPLARAIDGAEPGELIEFVLPGKTELIEVRAIASQP